MLFSTRIGRFAAGASLGIVALGTSGAAILAVTHPAMAQAAIAAVTTVTCSVTGTNWCIEGKNTSSGIGVLGASNSGTGVRGTANSNYGIKGTSGTSYGVYGASTSGFAGVAGTSSDYGVYGFTAGNGGGAGVYGSSVGGYGVNGFSGDTYGVFGQSDNNAGVAGTTFSGYGVYGYTTTSSGGTGVFGDSSNGFGVEGTTTTGSGTAVYGYESGAGRAVLGISATGFGVEGVSSEDPIVAANSSGTVVAFINSGGDLYYQGGLVHYGATRSGAVLTSFSPKAAAPTVEDTGTAQLVAGTASVRLDAAFAASIDPAVSYRVFITPDGDTPHGLFVAAKTPAGFVVREAQGGRSTVSFDYRIVASALGQAGQRMGVLPASAIPHAALPAVLAPKLPQGIAPTTLKPPPATP